MRNMKRKPSNFEKEIMKIGCQSIFKNNYSDIWRSSRWQYLRYKQALDATSTGRMIGRKCQ